MKKFFWFLLLLTVAPFAHTADITVTWINATTYTDGSVLAASDIASTTAWCGLTASTLTLSTTVTAPATTAVVKNALAGQNYVCGAAHTLKNGAVSAMSAVSSSIGIPAAKPNAPSGVTAVLAANTTAYKMRQSVDGIQMVAIGSVATGTQCGAHTVDGYSIVPRASVTLASRFDTMPLIVFAQCG